MNFIKKITKSLSPNSKKTNHTIDDYSLPIANKNLSGIKPDQDKHENEKLFGQNLNKNKIAEIFRKIT